MFDPHSLFGWSTVAVAPSPATSGTSLTVATGDGAKFAIGQNAVICPANTQPISTNAEVVRITNIVGDVLTITRAQEGSSARTVVVGDQIFNAITPKVLTDIQNYLNAVTAGAALLSPVLSGNVDGWIADNHTWVFATAATFTIAGVDLTAVFTKGTRLRFKQGAGYKYATVLSSAFSTNTTVTIAVNTDYTIANSAITDNGYSYAANPQGYPAYFNFTPTQSTSGGAYSNAPTVNYARYQIVGTHVIVQSSFTFNGSSGGSGFAIFGTPFNTMQDGIAVVGRDFSNGNSVFGMSQSATNIYLCGLNDASIIANSRNVQFGAAFMI